MPKAMMAGATALVLAGLLLGASDPWKTKSFSQWDANEVRKVMNDSPWAKLVQVPATWKPDAGAAAGTGGGLNPTGSSSSTTGRGGGGRGGPGGGSAPGGGDAGSTGLPNASFEVRWSSSRTFRAAAARSMVLSNQITEPEADKQMEEPQKYYEVTVVGRDMQPFEGLDEEMLKAATFLMAKKSKQKVSPESVSVSVGADGKTVQAVAFRFPKISKTGESTIGAEEKGIEFSTEVVRVSIKANFDVAKMEDNAGRDL